MILAQKQNSPVHRLKIQINKKTVIIKNFIGVSFSILKFDINCMMKYEIIFSPKLTPSYII